MPLQDGSDGSPTPASTPPGVSDGNAPVTKPAVVGGDNSDGGQSDDSSDDSSAPSNGTPSSGDSSSGGSSDDSSSSGGGDGDGGSSGGDKFGLDCDKFTKAVTDAGYESPASEKCDHFLNNLGKGSISSAREAAMFLSEILWESAGLTATSEIACKDNGCQGSYSTAGDPAGKSYYGRGYIQLTWSANYKMCSQKLYNDDRLYQDPDVVATDDNVSWQVSFCFWAENVHNAAGVQDGKFGAATKAINGALECNGGGAVDKAKKRYEIYKKVLAVFDSGSTPDESGCY
ncbi:hypothetical protein H4219_002830 [Mycoemilia scoparia]|uniref:Glycoside hydrolase family 19 catalytic domain-containing protein n=1 Tax=Mycoemilia scoparia TaxID=417184 RepID=A0A9W8A320_9FUNG|nr:hypothetical protein H4219_002830 [Mycoemilia scoparia]